MNQKSPTGKSLNIFPANSFHSFVDSDEAVKDPAVYSVTHTTKGENPDVTHDSAYSIQHSPGTGLHFTASRKGKQKTTVHNVVSNEIDRLFAPQEILGLYESKFYC